MAQRLRAVVALSEEPGLVASTCMAAYNCQLSLTLCAPDMHMVPQTHIQATYSKKHINLRK